MAATSNTFECFRDVVGLKVVGVMKDALPAHRADLKKGNKTLVFEDGTGLTFNGRGSYWRESKENVDAAVRLRRRELADTERDIRDVLTLAGAVA